VKEVINTSTTDVQTSKPVSGAFKSILVAVRNRSGAARAIELAARLATPGTTRVKVLHLQERVTYPSRSGPIEIETYKQAIDFAAKMQAELRELGVHGELEVGREHTGREAEQILLAAEDFGADLIIAGNHRKSGLETLLRGSTTRDIVRKSPVPVLLVRDAN
jgi:nucleotide-binding universal stress UspA family protein